jgi:hypothetical protein
MEEYDVSLGIINWWRELFREISNGGVEKVLVKKSVSPVAR